MCYSEGLNMPGVSDLASARGHEGTRTNQGSPIIYITEKAVQSMTFGLFVDASLFRFCSGSPAGFISTCFYSSKL